MSGRVNLLGYPCVIETEKDGWRFGAFQGHHEATKVCLVGKGPNGLVSVVSAVGSLCESFRARGIL
jgi:hypothetical protein